MKKSIFFAALMLGAFVLTSCNDESGTPQGDSTKLWPAQKDEASEWGFVNSSKEMKINAKYKEVQPFSCGYARVKTEDDEYVFIDKSGGKHTPKKDDQTEPGMYFNYGVCKVKYNDFWAFIDDSFGVISKGDFKDLGDMTADGLASYKIDGENEYGYCDKNGTQKIPARFAGAGPFMDGIAVVYEERDGVKWYYTIGKDGNPLCEETKKALKNLGEERVSYMNDGKVVICDKNLNPIDLAGTYYGCGECFTDGLLMVENRNHDKIGYINAKGQEIIPLEYSSGREFYEGLAWVRTTGNNQKWIVINNKDGQEKLQLTTRQNIGCDGLALSTIFHNGLTYYNNGTKVYLADKNGDVKYEWKMANGGGGYQPDPYDPYDPYGEAPAVNPMAGTKYGPLYEYNMKHFPKN